MMMKKMNEHNYLYVTYYIMCIEKQFNNTFYWYIWFGMAQYFNVLEFILTYLYSLELILEFNVLCMSSGNAWMKYGSIKTSEAS